MKNVNIHILSGNAILTPYKQKIKTSISAILKRLSKYITIENLDIIVVHDPEIISRGVVVIGSIIMKNSGLALSLNATHKHFVTLLDKKLICTLTHALYHIARYKQKGNPTLLIDAFIAEGIASHLEMALTDKIPTYNEVSTKKYEQMLKRARRNLFSKDYDYEEWFFGSKKRNILPHTGHVLGFHFIENYIKEYPKKTIHDILRTPEVKLRNEVLAIYKIKHKA